MHIDRLSHGSCSFKSRFFRWISMSQPSPARERQLARPRRISRRQTSTSSTRRTPSMSMNSSPRSTEVKWPQWVIWYDLSVNLRALVNFTKSTKTKDSLQFLAFLQYQAKWPFLTLRSPGDSSVVSRPDRCYFQKDLASKPINPINNSYKKGFWVRSQGKFWPPNFKVYLLKQFEVTLNKISGQQTNV